MKQPIFFLLSTLLMLSCSNKPGKADLETTSETADKLHTEIYVKDKSQYDQAFIDELAAYNEPIQLVDNFIVAGTDTTLFPDDLALNSATIFRGSKDNNEFELKVTRTSLTNLRYMFHYNNIGLQTDYTKSGTAILGAMFFLTSEADKDSQTGEDYLSTEYWDKTNDCWLSIRIGIGTDNEGKLRAKLTYGCEDHNREALSLDECPTLKTN